ncbi:MAG: hypothetical protein NT037_11085 [Hyphomicrobiales bacterium]|nr:hypothetical protein [Hyphomicrobiales bacterium]
MPVRLLLGGVFAGLAALTLGGCQTAGNGPDAGLAPVGNSYTETQARSSCTAAMGGGVRPVPQETLDICMRARMFGPLTERWD